MSNIELTIGGRPHRIACTPGQETHIRELGQLIDQSLAQVPSVSGQSEARSFLYASLILADEVFELRQTVARQEANLSAALPSQPDPAGEQLDLEIAETLENVAGKLESLASHLEEPATNA
ncbi:cell division protein ZapA [Altererythrobacter indicus]|uniref:Cell division protein ZapA n=1 Tax=Altericroceibacterium indicum TaxID=374177 RepID=A0A845A799_9SPHN|nr:cell division protein ZapA [Altericroceibacterium indicum]MXP25397.1 cell division protein ZapA [Altericroceibacterium indicum]